MPSDRKILAIIEPDNHPHGVVQRAVWLATLTGCDLELLLCDSDIGPLGDVFFVSNEAKEIGARIRSAQQEMIEELAAAGGDGVTITTDVLEERPIADGIMQRVLDTEPAYVVKGTQYHSVAERAIMVDTDQMALLCIYHRC